VGHPKGESLCFSGGKELARHIRHGICAAVTIEPCLHVTPTPYVVRCRHHRALRVPHHHCFFHNDAPRKSSGAPPKSSETHPTLRINSQLCLKEPNSAQERSKRHPTLRKRAISCSTDAWGAQLPMFFTIIGHEDDPLEIQVTIADPIRNVT